MVSEAIFPTNRGYICIEKWSQIFVSGIGSVHSESEEKSLFQLKKCMLCPTAAARPTASQILEETSRDTRMHDVSQALLESGNSSRLVPNYTPYPETRLPNGRLGHIPPVQRWTHRPGPILYVDDGDDDDDDGDDDDNDDDDDFSLAC